MSEERTMREVNRKGKENVQKNTKDYSLALNKLIQVVGEGKEYKKAVDRTDAKFRLLPNIDKLEKMAPYILESEKKLETYNYKVEIIENLDCIDVTKEKRYTIRVTKANIFVEVDLLEYRNNITEFEFDVEDFWAENISKITGSLNSECRKVAKIVAEYVSSIMYFKNRYLLTYKTIGWDRFIWDNNRWIFKYDQIYSNIYLLKGQISDGYGDGLTCVSDIDSNGIEKLEEILENKKAEFIKEYGEDFVEEVYNDLLNETATTLYSESGQAHCFNWVIHTIDLINKYNIDCLLIGAGVSGVIRSLLPFTKETNININITGGPASGKSIIGHYILSIFGDPERLEGSFTDTDNAMEQKRVQRPILPYILDERMLKMEGKSDTTKDHTIIMDIFREYEGKVKERLGKQYQDQAGERTYGPIISSSVESMMEYVYNSRDLGQYRRFMEFNVSRKDKSNTNTYTLFDNAEEAKKTEDIAYKNYGYGIIIFVKYLINLLDNKKYGEQYIINRFMQIDKDITNTLNDEEKTIREEEKNPNKILDLTSSSKRFALIVLSYQLFRESLILYIEEIKQKDILIFDKREEVLEKSKIIKDRSVDIINILVENLKQKYAIVNIVTETNNKLWKYIMNNKNAFFECNSRSDDWSKESKDRTWKLGKLIPGKGKKKGKIEICLIHEFGIDRLLFRNDIPDPDTIYKYIKDINKAKTEELREQIRKEYGALNDNQVKKFREENKQYDYIGYEQGVRGKFNNSEKDEKIVAIVIPEKMITVEEEKEKDKGQK